MQSHSSTTRPACNCGHTFSVSYLPLKSQLHRRALPGKGRNAKAGHGPRYVLYSMQAVPSEQHASWALHRPSTATGAHDVRSACSSQADLRSPCEWGRRNLALLRQSRTDVEVQAVADSLQGIGKDTQDAGMDTWAGHRRRQALEMQGWACGQGIGEDTQDVQWGAWHRRQHMMCKFGHVDRALARWQQQQQQQQSWARAAPVVRSCLPHPASASSCHCQQQAGAMH